MPKRLLDADGTTADIWHYDEATDSATIERVNPDVEPLLNRNGVLRNETDGYTPSRDLRHVATIDVVTYERWMMEAFGMGWAQRPAKDRMAVVKRQLNDPDFQKFRTVDVRV